MQSVGWVGAGSLAFPLPAPPLPSLYSPASLTSTPFPITTTPSLPLFAPPPPITSHISPPITARWAKASDLESRLLDALNSHDQTEKRAAWGAWSSFTTSRQTAASLTRRAVGHAQLQRCSRACTALRLHSQGVVLRREYCGLIPADSSLRTHPCGL